MHYTAMCPGARQLQTTTDLTTTTKAFPYLGGDSLPTKETLEDQGQWLTHMNYFVGQKRWSAIAF